jgi:uncharacterized protein YndB with AHSA1/START domain
METTANNLLTVEAQINAPAEKVWACWTEPRHITQWNHASPDWHSPRAENDLQPGGSFRYRMEARDGSMGFDFEGTYIRVEPRQQLDFQLGDGRKVSVSFREQNAKTTITETFEAENTHALEMQQQGWQAILNNFKGYVESADSIETLHFSIEINATAEKVYHCMLDKESYKEWTAIFNPGSHFKGSWEKGSKILFIGTDEKGQTGGMVSRIKEHIPNKLVTIEHLGLYHDGQEITTGPEVDGWAGAFETYRFTKKGSKTLLSIEADSNQQYKTFFEETWPKALDKLKAMCERA